MSRFSDYVCLVTGASRGIGRGIALGLGDLGATVYITGRTLKPKGENVIVAGSLEETATEINARGGKAVPVCVDHSKEEEVIELFDRIRREQRGRLDVVVNNAFAAGGFIGKNMDKVFYEIDDCTPGEAWDQVNNVGLRNDYVCCTLAARIMVDFQQQQKQTRRDPSATIRPGLIVNVSSWGGQTYLFNTAYGTGKTAVDRMTKDMALELKKRGANICMLSMWPGWVRTEELIALSQSDNSAAAFMTRAMKPDVSESVELGGRVVAALLKESPSKLMTRHGQVCLLSDIAAEDGVKEPDGSSPAYMRSLYVLLTLNGYRVARFIPKSIRVPKSLYMNWLANY